MARECISCTAITACQTIHRSSRRPRITAGLLSAACGATTCWLLSFIRRRVRRLDFKSSRTLLLFDLAGHVEVRAPHAAHDAERHQSNCCEQSEQKEVNAGVEPAGQRAGLGGGLAVGD